MKKFAPAALITTAAILGAVPTAVFAGETSQSVQAAVEEVAAPVEVNRGAMLYSASGHRIANVYRVTDEGNPQVILDGRLITVPASTLSEVDGKLTTTLSKRDIARSK